MPDVKMAGILEALDQKLSLMRNHAITSRVAALQTSALSLLYPFYCCGMLFVTFFFFLEKHQMIELWGFWPFKLNY